MTSNQDMSPFHNKHMVHGKQPSKLRKQKRRIHNGQYGYDGVQSMIESQ